MDCLAVAIKAEIAGFVERGSEAQK
jgi:hypothetical protein